MNRDIVFNISNNLDYTLFIDKEYTPSKFWSNSLPLFKYLNEVKNEINPDEIYKVYINPSVLKENNLSTKSFSFSYYFFINERRVNVNIKAIYPTEENNKFDISYYLEVKGQPADEKLVIDGVTFKAYFCIDFDNKNIKDNSKEYNLYFTLKMENSKRSPSLG